MPEDTVVINEKILRCIEFECKFLIKIEKNNP